MTKEQWMDGAVQIMREFSLSWCTRTHTEWDRWGQPHEDNLRKHLSQMWDEAYRQGAEEALNACDFEEITPGEWEKTKGTGCCGEEADGWNACLTEYQERKKEFLEGLK